MPGRIRTDHIKTSKSDQCLWHVPVTKLMCLNWDREWVQMKSNEPVEDVHITSAEISTSHCAEIDLCVRACLINVHTLFTSLSYSCLLLSSKLCWELLRSRGYLLSTGQKQNKTKNWISRVKQKQIKIPLTKVIRYKGKTKSISLQLKVCSNVHDARHVSCATKRTNTTHY